MQSLELDETGNEPRPSSMLQALVMVARRLGVETTLTHLRRSYVVGGNEPSSDVVVAMARDLRLDARAVTLRWRDLPRLHKTLPSILRLTDGTALVLVAIRDNPESGRIAVLQDPTALPDAIMAVDESRLCEVWSGEVILVKRRYAVDEDRPFGFAWLFGQLLRERRLFREIGLAAIFSTVFALAPPFLFMIVLDRVLVNHSYSTLIVITVALTLLVVFEMAFSFLRRLFTEVATTRIDARLNIYIMEKLFRLRMDYFERHPTGEIMSKVAQIWKVRNFLTGQLFGTFIDAVPLLGLVPAMIIVEWRLSIFVFALTGVIALIIYGFMPLLGRRFQKVVIAEQAKGAHLIENIYGMRTIKSMALEGRRRHDWDLRVAAAASARHDFGVVANYPQTLSLPFERLIYSGSLMLGAYMLLAHSDVMSAGALIAFSMLSMRLAQPLIQIARLQQDLGEAGGAIGELATVMNAPPEQTRAGTGLRLQVEGAISFQNLRFRYAPGAPYALDDVSFTIAPGMMFGIMGRSGSGKTTVTRLLQGLHADYEGIIKVDGMDLREIDLTHLRTSIGVVAQENFLFAGSIRENIAMARPDASFADIVRAAQMAGAEEFIERMPRGYETSLEEGAVNLSGGQRQRLAIARALLVDPPVLILDEATSALDAESEAIINANLQRIARGRTIICISHRLSMLVPANAVLVLERGQIYDIGSHDELLHRCDIYKHLWHQQNRHVERNAANIQLAVARPQQA